MCPACISALTAIVAAAASTGGIAAILVGKKRRAGDRKRGSKRSGKALAEQARPQ